MSTRLAGAADVMALIRADDEAMRALAAVERLALPDAWIGAGFVRNRVWDAMSGTAPEPLDDIDVVYFDPAGSSRDAERRFDAILGEDVDAPWSCKNQARMHTAQGNDFPPFASTEDGMAHWVETTAPIGARLENGRLHLVACYGLADLLCGVLRPTPPYAHDRLQVFHDRVSHKGWRRRWPDLRVDLASPGPGSARIEAAEDR